MTFSLDGAPIKPPPQDGGQAIEGRIKGKVMEAHKATSAVSGGRNPQNAPSVD